MVKDEPKLSRFEILGAWLNVWTPPRDAHVPPIPWRRIGIGTLVGLVLCGAAAAVIVPAVDESKDESAAREQRALDARATARRERLRVEQQPRFGEVSGDNRGEALAAIEAEIGRDAQARFNPRARPATCEASAGADEGADRVAYDCLSGVRDIVGAGDQEGARGTLGIPFRAIVDFGAGRYAFCKVNPPPGEQVIPDPRKSVALPKACVA